MTLTDALLLMLTTAAAVTEESFKNLFGKTVVKKNTDITRFTLITSVCSIISL